MKTVFLRQWSRTRAIPLLLELLLVAALLAACQNTSVSPRSTRPTPTPRQAVASATSTIPGATGTATPSHGATPRPGTSPTAGPGNGPGNGGNGAQPPTATATPGNNFVKNVWANVGYDSSVTCPNNVTTLINTGIDVTIPQLNNPASLSEQVTLHYLFSDGTRSPDTQQDFYGVQSSSTRQFGYSWTLPANRAGHPYWVQVVVTSPNYVTSSKVNYVFHCPNNPLQYAGLTLTDSPTTYDCTQSSINVTFNAQEILFDNPPDLNPNGYTFYYFWTVTAPSSAYGSPQAVQTSVPTGALTWSHSFTLTIKKSAGNGTYQAFLHLSTTSTGVPDGANLSVAFGVNC